MEDKSVLYQIPIPSTDVGGKIQFEHDGEMALLSFEYSQGYTAHRSVIEFKKVRGFRQRAEIHCSAWHIEVAYDTLVEVAPSRWAEEIIADSPERGQKSWVLRHFLIYLDSAGAYEVLAESWTASTIVIDAV